MDANCHEFLSDSAFKYPLIRIPSPRPLGGEDQGEGVFHRQNILHSALLTLH